MSDKTVQHEISEEIRSSEIELAEKEEDEATVEVVWVLPILRAPSQFYHGAQQSRWTKLYLDLTKTRKYGSSAPYVESGIA